MNVKCIFYSEITKTDSDLLYLYWLAVATVLGPGTPEIRIQIDHSRKYHDIPYCSLFAKFWGDKQRVLWYVMVFSGVVSWFISF